MFLHISGFSQSESNNRLNELFSIYHNHFINAFLTQVQHHCKCYNGMVMLNVLEQRQAPDGNTGK